MNSIKINWNLHDHCTGGCSYCPSYLWGGGTPNEVTQYLAVTKKIIEHYAGLGRTVDWTFNGGEPLEMFDFPMILKLCKESQGSVELFTNGGKIWLDWWAIEPYVDKLTLSYHYWQNPSLVEFIIDQFVKNNKPANIIVPIRPDYFNDDIDRALSIEKKYGIVVDKFALYKESNQSMGLFDYTDEQLRIIRGESLVEENIHYKETTLAERFEEKIKENPIYTGMNCNVGIEHLNISHNGWVSGSQCNNSSFGNIWQDNFNLPAGPSVCKMQACIHPGDQQITKFL
jgi:MoaA/NifB/PqqE/SkfB family radical SAM enzyme